MLNDSKLMEAVSAILQRSERQPDKEKLLSTFVDVGIVSQLHNRNNQVVFGRRGTGKTHILRFLENKLSTDSKHVVLYLDARTLGSTSQFSDPSVPLRYRCTALFRDILSEIHNCLREHLVSLPESNGHAELECLDEFRRITTESIPSVTEEQIGSKETTATGREKSISADLAQSPSLNAKIAHSRGASTEHTKTFTVKKDDKVVFPEVRSLLTEILQGCGSTLFILLDEWSSLPIDIQPFLAEFMKRAFLPNPYVVLKIASLEFRSSFNCQLEGMQLTGFELGADISGSVLI